MSRFYRQRYKISEKIKVNVTTLDGYFRGKKLKKHILLKIDTQGTELAVLRGAKNLLRGISFIHVESPLKKLYRGQSFFEDIHKFLVARNFEYVGDIPDSLFYPRFSLPDVVNGVYINTSILRRLT